MKLQKYKLRLLAVWCCLLSTQGYAHETEVCLQQIAQAAEQLQRCLVEQQALGGCDSASAIVTQYQNSCRDQYFTASAISRATLYGRDQVEGSPEQSPYQRQQARARWLETRMRPNLERYMRSFPQYDASQPSLTEHFGEQECPDGYRGQPGRWLYRGAVTLVRYTLTDTVGPSSSTVTKHYFEPEAVGQCYPIPEEPSENDPLVVNTPQTLLQDLQALGVLVKCESSTCSGDKQQLEEHYQQYQAAYRQYRLLMQCADIEARNQKRGSVKGNARSVQLLPEYCPQAEVEVAYLNGKGLVEQLDHSLFGTLDSPIQQAKSVQN